jgi:hypothetical protein
VLHVATLNQPIRPDLGYGPIETVIYNIDKGLHSLGHRSIVACSGDSRVAGEHYVTVNHSIDIIHTHDAKAVEFMYNSVSSMHVPIVMTLHVSSKESLLGGAYQRWCNPLLSSPQVYCAAISEYQKSQYNYLVNAENVVHHGIDVEEFPVKEAPD